MDNLIRVTLKKSGIGGTKRQKNTLKGLGLTKLNKAVYLKDTQAIRGMVNKVSHLIEVEYEA